MKTTILVTTAAILLPFSAAAMSADEYITKLDGGAQAAFMGGAIGMAMFDGSPERAKCIGDWYFESGKAPDEIAEVFTAYKAKPAAGLLKVLIDRKCGKPE